VLNLGVNFPFFHIIETADDADADPVVFCLYSRFMTWRSMTASPSVFSFSFQCHITIFCQHLHPPLHFSFIRPVMFSSKLSGCLKMLSLPDHFYYLSILLHFCRHFIPNFIHPVNFSILCRIHISKASDHQTFAFVSVRVSAAYSATLNTSWFFY